MKASACQCIPYPYSTDALEKYEFVFTAKVERNSSKKYISKTREVLKGKVPLIIKEKEKTICGISSNDLHNGEYLFGLNYIDSSTNPAEAHLPLCGFRIETNKTRASEIISEFKKRSKSAMPITKPQILIPSTNNTKAYTGKDWFAVPHISYKKATSQIIEGSVAFLKPETNDFGYSAEFTPKGNVKFNSDTFFEHTYVRGIFGMKAGEVDLVQGLECIDKSKKGEQTACTLKLKDSKIVIAEKYLEFIDRAGSARRQYFIGSGDNNVNKLSVEATELAFAGDLNHDGGIDLIFTDSDAATTTTIYMWDSRQKNLKLVVRATSEGH